MDAMPRQQRKPAGPRPGRPDTRAHILSVAREQFARGYDASTLRGVARAAGVDPSLVVQFFGGKDGLFMAAMTDALRPAEGLTEALADVSKTPGERVALYFLGLWEQPETRGPIQAMFLSAASHPPAAELLREFVSTEVVGRIAAVAKGDRARLRAALAGTQLVGAAFARYIVGIPELTELSVEDYARVIGHAINRHLQAPLRFP